MTSTRMLVGEDSPAVGTNEMLPIDLVRGAMGESGAAAGSDGGVLLVVSSDAKSVMFVRNVSMIF